MAEIPVGNLKKLNIIHKAMLFGQLLFAAIAFFLVYSGTMTAVIDKQTDKILQVLVIVLAAAGFFAGTALFKRQLLSVRDTELPAQQKFATYRAASILQWAMIEGPVLFCIICFLLSGNYALLILAVVLLICFAMLAPARQKVAFQLGLSSEEAEGI